MFGYQCYFLSRESQIRESRILALRNFHANSYPEALATARTLSLEQNPCSFELWQGIRYLHGEGCTTPTYH
jgi:hypothetical protein